MERLEITAKETAKIAECEKEQIKKANTALIGANSQSKMSNLRGTPGFGDQGEPEWMVRMKNMEQIIADNQKMFKDLRKENTDLKLVKQPLCLMPVSEGCQRRDQAPALRAHEDTGNGGRFRRLSDGTIREVQRCTRRSVRVVYSLMNCAIKRWRNLGDQEARTGKLNELSESAAASSSMSSSSRGSPKEESKVVVPPLPTVNDLGLWQVRLIQAVIVAAIDPDQQPWIDWIKEAIDDPNPDKLEDSGDLRFHTIDAKLGLALQKVVTDAKDDVINVSMKLWTRLNAKGRSSDFYQRS